MSAISHKRTKSVCSVDHCGSLNGYKLYMADIAVFQSKAPHEVALWQLRRTM